MTTLRKQATVLNYKIEETKNWLHLHASNYKEAENLLNAFISQLEKLQTMRAKAFEQLKNNFIIGKSSANSESIHKATPKLNDLIKLKETHHG